MLLVLKPLAHVFQAPRKSERSLALVQSIDKVSFIIGSVFPRLRSFAIVSVVFERAFVDLTVWVEKLALPALLVVNEIT